MPFSLPTVELNSDTRLSKDACWAAVVIPDGDGGGVARVQLDGGFPAIAGAAGGQRCCEDAGKGERGKRGFPGTGAVRAAAAAVAAGCAAFLGNACCAAVGAHVHAGFLLVLGRFRIGAGRRFRIGWARSCGLGGWAGGGAIACVVARVVAVIIGEVGARGVGPVWFVSGVPNLIIPVNARETIDSPCFAGGFYVRGSIWLVPRRRGGVFLVHGIDDHGGRRLDSSSVRCRSSSRRSGSALWSRAAR